MSDKNVFMKRAIELSIKSSNGHGGPFGAVIVQNGKIIGEGNNQVTTNNDPTAHAEVVAIREACQTISNFNLSDCEIYTSCEPCPMCLSAIYWARIPKIYYANTRKDAANIGFDDSLIYDEINLPITDRSVLMTHMSNTDAIQAFETWSAKEDKTKY